MKALVTGGAGFIGSNIVDLLVSEGYDVVVVDDLSTGKKENINDSAVFREVDITSPKLDSVFMEEKPDYVIHQAAQINVRKSVTEPEFDARVNILGSINLLECCRRHGVKRVVYASSGGAVYGEPEYLPADESHPVNPLCPYGASKYAVEKYLFLYSVNYGLDYIILRYGNVYGPRQDPLGEAGVVAIFTKKMLLSDTPVINGDGGQTRDFVHVKDVARANLLALRAKTGERVFNIGSGVETSVNEITKHLMECTGAKVKPKHGPEVKGEVRRIYLNVGLAGSELKWAPVIGLEDGLKETVEWTRNE
ncbi:MAG: SDR family oxidoreductase [Candidatus Altiarchaeota archaeon]